MLFVKTGNLACGSVAEKRDGDGNSMVRIIPHNAHALVHADLTLLELSRVRADDCPRRKAQCGEMSEQWHMWLRQSGRGCKKSNRGDTIGCLEDRTEAQRCQQASTLVEGLGVLDVQMCFIDEHEVQNALLGRVEHIRTGRRMVDQKLWRG